MIDIFKRLDEMKRKLRELKKLELKIRFNGIQEPDKELIWDVFFDVRETNKSKAKYSLRMLATMSQQEYEQVIHEYWSFVYFEHYKENGFNGAEGAIFDPNILAKLGLPFNSDENDIKKRFRELAKQYHPDAGGDQAKFIELMNLYNELMGKR